MADSRVISMPTLVASVVPLFWNSRHTQTSLQTVPIYSPQAADSCQKQRHGGEST